MPMPYQLVFSLVIGLLIAARPASGAVVTFSLGAPSSNGSHEDIDIGLNFQSADPLDRLEAVYLNFTLSDPLLLTSGPEMFSRFSFDVNASALPLWTSEPFLLTAIGQTVLLPPDVANGPFISPGNIVLGTLHLDLNGFAAGTLLSVSLAGGTSPDDATDATLHLHDLDQDDTNDVIDVASLLGTVNIPNDLTFEVTPEPSSLAMFGGLIIAGLARRGWRHRRRLAA